jgi:catechol 2,3-dioxygenase-like lactoylglutathione lyase family enzyme
MRAAPQRKGELMRILDFDHVNLAIPTGEEDKARAFYAGVLGLSEIEKPESLQRRGGCWFGNGRLQVHLGIEDGFRPARRAHPAFLVEGLDELKARCEAAGHKIVDDRGNPDYHRFFTSDPFGNRIECMERIKG